MKKRLYCLVEDDLLAEHEIVCQRCGGHVVIVAEDNEQEDTPHAGSRITPRIDVRLTFLFTILIGLLPGSDHPKWRNNKLLMNTNHWRSGLDNKC